MKSMKDVMWFGIYGMFLLNVYVWMTCPPPLAQTLWKLDIFIVLLLAPVFYWNIKDERKD